MLDALKSEAPHRITVVLPCVEYARQDRKFEAGEAIAPKLLLHLMVTAGADRFVTIDLHNQAESGFSPVHAALDELTCVKYLANSVRELIPGIDAEDTLVCATDAGGAKRTRKMADELQVGFMMADKFRPAAGEVGQVKIICDTTMTPRNVIIVDDMFDSCNSLVKVVEAVRNFAPEAQLFAVGTHGYFSQDAVERVANMVKNSGLQWIASTNSISPTMPLEKFRALGIEERFKIVDISRLVAGAIIRIHLGPSVNLAKFRQLGPLNPDPLLTEAAFVPTSQYTLRGAARAPVPGTDDY